MCLNPAPAGKAGRHLADENDMGDKMRHVGNDHEGLTEAVRKPQNTAMTLGRTLCRIRAALWQLPVLLALVVLALLPPGVMPRVTADGLAMVICSDAGAVVMVIDPTTGALTPEAPDSGKSGDRAICGWAMAQSLPDLVQPFALSAPTTVAHAVTPTTASVSWRPAYDPRGLYARGPPTLI